MVHPGRADPPCGIFMGPLVRWRALSVRPAAFRVQGNAGYIIIHVGPKYHRSSATAVGWSFCFGFVGLEAVHRGNGSSCPAAEEDRAALGSGGLPAYTGRSISACQSRAAGHRLSMGVLLAVYRSYRGIHIPQPAALSGRKKRRSGLGGLDIPRRDIFLYAHSDAHDL